MKKEDIFNRNGYEAVGVQKQGVGGREYAGKSLFNLHFMSVKKKIFPQQCHQVSLISNCGALNSST